MTSFPAERLGLRDRGRAQAGFKADLVIFDPQRIAAGSDHDAPRRMPEGIDDVLVNGRRVVEAGRYRPAAAGQVLRRTA